jgi:chromosomal replication initiator protein
MECVSNMESLWQITRKDLAERISENNLKLWIDPLIPLENKGKVLTLGCPNRFFLAWIREHYLPLILETLHKTCGRDDEVEGVDLQVAPHQKGSASPNEPLARQQELPHVAARTSAPLRFNPKFTFETFVVGNTNQYAYSAVQAMANGRELNTDSLYLLSDHGLGKSHLSQALGHHVLRHRNGARVYYLTAEDFTNELVYSLKNRCVEDFKNKYRRACDVLVLEEVHFLSGKEKVQNELCYALDCLAENGKKVVLTSARLPREIPRLGKSFASRLSNCLISTIEPPDYATRLRILERKARDYGLNVRTEVLEFMAERIKRDVRQMESCLNSLGAKSRLMNRPVDMTLAQETLGDLVGLSRDLTVEAVIKQVCRYYQVARDDLVSRSRKKEHVLPRNVGIYLTRRLTDMSLQAIGKAFGRNHSTILHSVNLIEGKARRDTKLKNQVDFLTQQVTSGNGSVE